MPAAERGVISASGIPGADTSLRAPRLRSRQARKTGEIHVVIVCEVRPRALGHRIASQVSNEADNSLEPSACATPRGQVRTLDHMASRSVLGSVVAEDKPVNPVRARRLHATDGGEAPAHSWNTRNIDRDILRLNEAQLTHPMNSKQPK